MGFIIGSPALAGQLAEGLKRHQADHTCVVALALQSDLQEQMREEGRAATFDSEPDSSTFKRFAVWFCSLLPVERLL